MRPSLHPCRERRHGERAVQRRLALVAALLALALPAGCGGGAGATMAFTGLVSPAAPSDSARRGALLIRELGCGSCHTVPGVRGADGKVAPPLDFFSRRSFIAGQLPNTPANLQRWLKDPPAVEPGTAMPDLGLSDAQARDIAAYLLTLR